MLFKAAPRWNVYANVGEGFETPTFAELAYRPNGATGFNFALQPASSRHVEFGIKGRLPANTKRTVEQRLRGWKSSYPKGRADPAGEGMK